MGVYLDKSILIHGRGKSLILIPLVVTNSLNYFWTDIKSEQKTELIDLIDRDLPHSSKHFINDDLEPFPAYAFFVLCRSITNNFFKLFTRCCKSLQLA